MSTNNIQRQLPDNIKIADLSITDDIISNSTGNVTIDTTGNVVINATSNLVVKSNSSNELHFGYENLYGGQGGGEWKIVNTDANSNIHLVTTDSNGAQNNVMVADSYGRVGIGTSSPGTILQVHSGTHVNEGVLQTWSYHNGSAERTLQLKQPSTSGTTNDNPFIFYTPNSMKFSVDGGDSLCIDHNGRVGIGTDNPTEKLHIQTDTAGEDVSLLIRNSDSSNDNSSAHLEIRTNGTNSGDPYIQLDTDGVGGYTMGIDNSDNHKFKLNYGAPPLVSNTNPRIVIDTSGNVGIGTTSPSSKLDINGNVHLSANKEIYFADDGTIRCFDNYHSIVFDRSDNTLSINEYGTIKFNTGASYDNRMIIKNDGKVGIGTTNPSQKLHVSGNVLANNVSVSSDDRLKENEQIILNASDTIMNLKPQVYDKKPDFNNSNVETWIRESGLIAQEVYYDAPELRHLVTPGSNASNIDVQISSSDDPSVDPDYSNWGDLPASLNYTGFIPYLIKMNQEQQSTINELKSRIEALENP